MSHVFVSYVRDDLVVVERISHELRKRGVEVWLDRDRIQPGERWKSAIRSAILHGACFVACFSSAYAAKTSTYMNEELTLAIDELRQKSIARKWFIPVLLSECEVPARSIGGGETLLDFQWIDLYTDFADGVDRLYQALNGDGVARLRDLIDEMAWKYGYKVHNPSFDNDDKDSARARYRTAVAQLERDFGIIYDPIRLRPK